MKKATKKSFNLVPGCLAGRALGEVGVYPILLDLYIWLGFRFLGVGYFAFVVEVGDISHWKEGISVKEAQVHLIQGFGVLKSKWNCQSSPGSGLREPCSRHRSSGTQQLQCKVSPFSATNIKLLVFNYIILQL